MFVVCLSYVHAIIMEHSSLHLNPFHPTTPTNIAPSSLTPLQLIPTPSSRFRQTSLLRRMAITFIMVPTPPRPRTSRYAPNLCITLEDDTWNSTRDQVSIAGFSFFLSLQSVCTNSKRAAQKVSWLWNMRGGRN